MSNEDEVYENSLRNGLENLLQFFALPADQQLMYLPSTMPMHFYDQNDVVSNTDKPLEAMIYNLKEHCRACSAHAWSDSFEHIDEAMCNELFAFCEILISYWWDNAIDIDGEISSRGVTWRNSTLKDHSIWNLLRRVARIALNKNGWAVKTPDMDWDELVNM